MKIQAFHKPISKAGISDMIQFLQFACPYLDYS
jgi:hypothetical protein